MTRINLTDPRDLTDEHLFAEWREGPRVFPLASAWIERGCDTPIPRVFTLGAGHVAFFYTRLGWLAHRHAALTAECLARGYRLTPRPPLVGTGDWTPSPADVAVSVCRLREALARSKRVQHYRGRVVPPSFYDRLEPRT